MKAAPNFWRAVENLFPVYTDVQSGWRRRLGDEYEMVAPLLRPDGRVSDVYPCPFEWGCLCNHEVVEHRDDCFSAVPDEDARDRCQVVKNLPREEVIRYEIEVQSVWDAVVAVLDVKRLHQPIPIDEASFQLGNWHGIPVHVAIPQDRYQLLQTAQHLALESMDPFVLLAPTARMYCAEADSVMRMRKALFIPLSEHVGFDGQGRLLTASSLKQLVPLPADTVEAAENIFRRHGEYWDIVYDGRPAHMKHSKGIGGIVFLLRTQGRALHVAQILVEVAGEGSVPLLGSAGEVLTPTAIAEYKEALLDLRERIHDAEQHKDFGTKTALEEQLSALTQHLGSALGLHGRPRKASDDAERIRKAVWGNIKRALDKMKKAHPPLWEHLSRSLTTGMFMSYSPSSPVDWQF